MSRAMPSRLGSSDTKPSLSTLAGLTTSLGVSMSRPLQGLGGDDGPGQVVRPSEGLHEVRAYTPPTRGHVVLTGSLNRLSLTNRRIPGVPGIQASRNRIHLHAGRVRAYRHGDESRPRRGWATRSRSPGASRAAPLPCAICRFACCQSSACDAWHRRISAWLGGVAVAIGLTSSPRATAWDLFHAASLCVGKHWVTMPWFAVGICPDRVPPTAA
jgi:hypothetical protein